MTFNRHTIFIAKNNLAIKKALREVSEIISEAGKAELTPVEKICLIKGCEQLGLYFAFSSKRKLQSALDYFAYGLELADNEHPPVHFETMLIYLNLIKKQDNNDQALEALRNANKNLKKLIEEQRQLDTADGIFKASELYIEYMHCYAFLLRAETDELLNRAYTSRKTPAAKAEYESKFSESLTEALVTLEQLPVSPLNEAELARVSALRGWALYLSKQYSAAKDLYLKALMHWDNFKNLSGGLKHHYVADTNYQLGLVLVKLNEYADAISCFKAAIEVARNYYKSELNIFVVEVKFNLASVYVSQKLYNKAFEEFEKLLIDAKTIKFKKVVADAESIMTRLTAVYPGLLHNPKDSTDATIAMASLSILTPQHSVRFFPTESSSSKLVEPSTALATLSTNDSSPSVPFAP